MSTRPPAVGVNLDCDQGRHRDCADPACRCGCHISARELIRERVPAPADFLAGAPPTDNGTKLVAKKICPACMFGTTLETDKYCRRCGSLLADSGYCPACQVVTISGDAFCWSCGGRL